MPKQPNDKPLTLSDLSQPIEYEEASRSNEFEVDWDKVFLLDQFSRKLVAEGKMSPPMKKKDG
tara:strand:+ start:296 stop:484 length:189 start_codon:yes stop_codon:yes gene_type:complete